MPTESFQIGQHVRIAKNTPLRHLIGREGEVIEHDCKARGYVAVRLNHSFVWLCFPARELEVVTLPKNAPAPVYAPETGIAEAGWEKARDEAERDGLDLRRLR